VKAWAKEYAGSSVRHHPLEKQHGVEMGMAAAERTMRLHQQQGWRRTTTRKKKKMRAQHQSLPLNSLP